MLSQDRVAKISLTVYWHFSYFVVSFMYWVPRKFILEFQDTENTAYYMARIFSKEKYLQWNTIIIKNVKCLWWNTRSWLCSQILLSLFSLLKTILKCLALNVSPGGFCYPASLKIVLLMLSFYPMANLKQIISNYSKTSSCE